MKTKGASEALSPAGRPLPASLQSDSKNNSALTGVLLTMEPASLGAPERSPASPWGRGELGDAGRLGGSPSTARLAKVAGWDPHTTSSLCEGEVLLPTVDPRHVVGTDAGHIPGTLMTAPQIGPSFS